MHLRPYLTFDGRCAEAMRFYQRVLGGQLDVMNFGDMPPGDPTGHESDGCPGGSPLPPEAKDRVMHARLVTGDGDLLMASDTVPGQPYEGMKGLSVTLAFATVDEARRAFDALADGGQVGMPLAPTFWARAFGMVTDRFGTPWLVNGEMIAPPQP